MMRYLRSGIFLGLVALVTASVGAASPPAGWETWRALGNAVWSWTGEVGSVSARAGGGGWRTRPGALQDVRITLRYRCRAQCAPALRLREFGGGAIEVPLSGPSAGHPWKVGSDGSRTPIGTPVEGGDPARPGEWVDVIVSLRGGKLNARVGAREANADVKPLLAAGTVSIGVVRPGATEFSAITVSDLTRRAGLPRERLSKRFQMTRLSDLFYSEGATTGDVNGDGIADVVAGPLYYLGPDFQEVREIAPAAAASPNSYVPAFQSHVADLTGDGRKDVLTIGFNRSGNLSNGAFGATLFINPGATGRHWESAVAVAAMTSENSRLVDLLGDGRERLLLAVAGQPGYAEPDHADPRKPWTFTAVGPPGSATAHGLGAGDINGDGRLDVLTALGWHEQPAKGSGEGWIFHPATFGSSRHDRRDGGADMFAYDVNGDGRADVVTSLDGHGWGLAWFEQRRDADGRVGFARHLIANDQGRSRPDEFSQLHALALADIDKDGLQDIVTGKRWWGHLEGGPDPDTDNDPVLYWYRLERSQGSVRYVPELIHNLSGLGTQLHTADVNGDGKPDVLAAGRRGVFLFQSR